MTKPSPYFLPFFFLLTSLATLSVAYIAEYFFGLKPCVLCMYQRVPYAALIGVSLLSLILLRHRKARKFLNLISIFILLIGSSIAFYHMGVEYKWFEGLSSCSGQTGSVPQTLEEMRAQLLGTKAVRCDQPQFIFLTLSMAGWNMVWSLLLAAIAILAMRAERNAE